MYLNDFVQLMTSRDLGLTVHQCRCQQFDLFTRSFSDYDLWKIVCSHVYTVVCIVCILIHTVKHFYLKSTILLHHAICRFMSDGKINIDFVWLQEWNQTLLLKTVWIKLICLKYLYIYSFFGQIFHKCDQRHTELNLRFTTCHFHFQYLKAYTRAETLSNNSTCLIWVVSKCIHMKYAPRQREIHKSHTSKFKALVFLISLNNMT